MYDSFDKFIFFFLQRHLDHSLDMSSVAKAARQMKHTTREERLAARDKLFRSRYETIQNMGFSQLSQLHLLSTRKTASFCATSAFLFSQHLVTVARFLLNGKNTDDAVSQAVSDYLVEKSTEAADIIQDARCLVQRRM